MQLVEGKDNKEIADTTANYPNIYRNFFVGLTQLRLERGYAINVLKKEPDADLKHRQT